jgi:hypothetical protein
MDVAVQVSHIAVDCLGSVAVKPFVAADVSAMAAA